jgi:hypothetical protein
MEERMESGVLQKIKKRASNRPLFFFGIEPLAWGVGERNFHYITPLEKSQ